MRYYMPVKIVWGDPFSAFSEISKPETVVLVTGRHFAREYGYIDVFRKIFVNQNLGLYNNIPPNPQIEDVENLISFLRKVEPQMVIGFGGGSVIDAAKLANALWNDNIDVEDVFYFRKQVRQKTTLFVAIPTTTGTGSEVTPYSVLTHNNDKHGVASDHLFPDYAILWVDPVMKQPKDLLIDSTVDALTHAIEGLLSERNKGLMDAIALNIIGAIYEELPHQCEFITKSGMERLQDNAMLAGVVIAQRGTLLLHAAGYPLTVNYGISHGRANLLLLPSFLLLMEEKGVDISPVLNAMNIKHPMQIYDWYVSLGIETSFDHYGIQRSDLMKYVDEVLNKKNLLVTPGNIGKEDIVYMYEVAYENS